MCKTKCKTKWIMLDDKRVSEYGTSIINCGTCKRILYPRFVHCDIDNDYTCYLCDKTGFLIYFCISCKKYKK